MKNFGYDNPLYILPSDHRSSFESKMFGWGEDLTPEQTEEIVATKQVIYNPEGERLAEWETMQ